MAIASGVAGLVRARKETNWGTLAATTGAQTYNRRSCSLDLAKDSYQSEEITPTYQVSDFRHGARRVEGDLTAELSPGGHAAFVQSGLRRDFAAIAASTATMTIATSTTLGGIQLYTIARSAGNWLTDGYKAGMVGRLTAGTFNAANLNKNFFVVALGTGTMTGFPANAVAMVGEGPIANGVFSATGKYTYTPASGQTNDSYTVERWFPDVGQSRVFSGCRVRSLGMQLPPSGMALLSIGFLGKDLAIGTSTAYFASPTAAPSIGKLAAVNGAILIGGTPRGVVTGLDISVDGGHSVGQVVGANVTPDVFVGRVRVSGNVRAYFEDATLLDAFKDETEMALAMAFFTGVTGTADFMSFMLPRVKFGSAAIDDGEKGLEVSASFQALYNSAGGAGQSSEQTTLAIQDSQAA